MNQYIGKSPDDLGIKIPGQQPLLSQFEYGVEYPGKSHKGKDCPFSESDRVLVGMQDAGDPDILVSTPGEFSDVDAILVVILHKRTVRKDRLLNDIKHLGENSDGYPVWVFTPEKDAGNPSLANYLQSALDQLNVPALVYPYYPDRIDA